MWVYDSFGRLAAEYRNGSGPGFSASSPEREYVYFAGKLTAVVEGSEIYYRTTDHLGSTRLVTDSGGDVKQRRDFFPFGENIPADSSHGGRNGVTDGGVATYNASLWVRQQFTGQQRDEETGLDYFEARDYQPCLARFLSIDPESAGANAEQPQSWNAYSYTYNLPMSRKDPDGRDPECVWNEHTNTLDCPISDGLDPFFVPYDDFQDENTADPADRVMTPAQERDLQYWRVARARRDVARRKADSFNDNCLKGLKALGVTADELLSAVGSLKMGDNGTGLYEAGFVSGNLGLPVGFDEIVANPTVDDAFSYAARLHEPTTAATITNTVYWNTRLTGNDSPETLQADWMHEALHSDILDQMGDKGIMRRLFNAGFYLNVNGPSAQISGWFEQHCVPQRE